MLQCLYATVVGPSWGCGTGHRFQKSAQHGQDWSDKTDIPSPADCTECWSLDGAFHPAWRAGSSARATPAFTTSDDSASGNRNAVSNCRAISNLDLSHDIHHSPPAQRPGVSCATISNHGISCAYPSATGCLSCSAAARLLSSSATDDNLCRAPATTNTWPRRSFWYVSMWIASVRSEVIGTGL